MFKTDRALFIFSRIDSGVYKVLKDRFGHFEGIKYVTNDVVVRYLNEYDSCVVDSKFVMIHSNF